MVASSASGGPLGSKASSNSSSNNNWPCPRCTFSNTSVKAKCDVCGFLRPAPVSAAEAEVAVGGTSGSPEAWPEASPEAWRTISVEGKRRQCEALAAQLVAKATAAGGTDIRVCGYPEFAAERAAAAAAALVSAAAAAGAGTGGASAPAPAFAPAAAATAAATATAAAAAAALAPATASAAPAAASRTVFQVVQFALVIVRQPSTGHWLCVEVGPSAFCVA